MKKTIMILHQSASEAAQLSAALLQLGYQGVCHCEPRGVVAALTSTKPDFVAIEMERPLIDGAKLCKLIRTDPLTRHLPILLLTRTSPSPLVSTAVELGAQGVAVGVTPTQLAQDIIVLMERRRPLLPPNEKQRMATLRSLAVLDTVGDPILNELTQAASILTGTPIAVVSLVDEKRQWFKSIIGLDVTETPREAAFCAHAIWGSEILEVNDATQDIRFAANPLVTSDPNIRFYAGAPIITSDGCGMGTLCVIDRIPRVLTSTQREVLTRLSRVATLVLERNRADLAKAAPANETGALAAGLVSDSKRIPRGGFKGSQRST